MRIASLYFGNFSKILLVAFSFLLLPFLVSAQNIGQAASSRDAEDALPQKENECARYLMDTRSPEKLHTQMEHRPLFIEGPLGTEVLIPADAFVHEDGSPVKGSVQVLFSEFTKKSDMLLSNLPTISNGKMLVSGGVINLEAIADGKRVKLAAGKSVLVNFPGGNIEGMELFRGQYDAVGKLNWVPFSDLPQTAQRQQANLEVAPQAAVPAFLDYGKVNPKTFRFADGETDVESYIKSVLLLRYSCAGNDAVYIELDLDENGQAKSARSLTGKNRCYRMAIEEVAMSLVFEVSEPRTVYFVVKPIIPMVGKPGENVFASQTGRTDLQNDPALRKVLEEYMEENRVQNFAVNAMAVSELGLINCDHFYGRPGKRVSISADVQNASTENQVKAFLVFDDLNSAMEGELNQNSQYTFRNIPEGLDAKIVVIGYSKTNGPSLSVKKVRTTNGNVGTLSLKPVSEAELKAAMAAI